MSSHCRREREPLELLIMLDAFKRLGSRVTASCPYYGYARRTEGQRAPDQAKLVAT